MDPALLRNIALQTNDKGEADAQLALAARRMIDRNGQIQINPDDLPASMRALGGAGAVPMWVKYSVTLAQFLAGELGVNNFLFLELIPDATDVFIYDAVIRPTESFAGVGADEVIVSVGGTSPGLERIESLVKGEFFGDGPGIENDRTYITHAQVASNYTYMNLFPGSNIGFAKPTSIRIYLRLTAPSTHEDYEGLTAGAVDVWLLLSKLPA
jgi:hypothetical protein